MKTYAVDRKNWHRLSLFEQMGNIGSEVGRTFNAARRGDAEGTRSAMIRALDLFDATCESPRRNYPQLKELLRAKEEFLSALHTRKDETNQKTLENYFMIYAVTASKNR